MPACGNPRRHVYDDHRASTKAAPEFTGLAESSQRVVSAYIKLIENEFGDLPFAALAIAGCAANSRAGATVRRNAAQGRLRLDDAGADHVVRKDRGIIATNPCERGGRLYVGRPDRASLERTRISRPCSRSRRRDPARADAGPVDRPTARRPAAPAMVRLRRHPSACGSQRPAGGSRCPLARPCRLLLDAPSVAVL